MHRQKIIVGMSGGVDSSVAALLLLEQGYQVEGLFMKNWEEDDDADYCAAADDLADARSVCATLGIPLHSVNFASEYWDRVFKHFLHEYSAGRTPNPDILCNREIKFHAFLDHAITLGADRIATGHYARTRVTNGHTRLLRGVDENKDQSYFLHALSESQLEHALFPLGELPKDEVRAIARRNGLATHDKKDSTGICFIGERRFDTFLQRYLPAKPGVIQSDTGETLGEHHGLMYYTMGQRKGLGIGGLQHADETPWYVVDKDLAQNILIVAQGQDHPRLYHDTLETSHIHWINGADSAISHCTAKIRYRQADQVCSLHSPSADRHVIRFEQPQRAITPGQSIVFYQDEVCLGGGIIESMYDSG
ncbi:MAG: tRNA 2-thiouridine(34) synthase MnmA [Thiotrichales bacterium]|nr:MAG: tRNA 2-thiouridine(34) synthase MnmA [Thiotrichales bacterium]